MNDLTMLTKFFQFLQQSRSNSRQNIAKLITRLPGSDLLLFAYEHLRPSPLMDEEEKQLLKTFVLIFSEILQFLLELHPLCWSQIESIGIFDRLEKYGYKNPVCFPEKTS
jgi:hypothetical protein